MSWVGTEIVLDGNCPGGYVRGGNVLGGDRNCPGWELSWGGMSAGELSYTRYDK